MPELPDVQVMKECVDATSLHRTLRNEASAVGEGEIPSGDCLRQRESAREARS